jgi:hypothetical protein
MRPAKRSALAGGIGEDASSALPAVACRVGLLIAPLSLTACGRGTCSSAAPADTIVGRLVARNGSTATFTVESVLPSSGPRQAAPTAPVLEPGQTLTVEYYQHHARFLRVGTRYQVALFWRDSSFESDVHTASDPCSWGTTYADGRAIDTATWASAHLREIVAVVVLVPLVLAGLAIFAARRTVRRLRQPRSSRRARVHGDSTDGE